MIQDIPDIFWVAVAVALILGVALSVAWGGLIYREMIDRAKEDDQ